MEVALILEYKSSTMVRKDNLIMKKISKYVQVLMIALSVFLLFPTFTFAADDNPFRKMSELMKFNFGVLDGLDWIFIIIMIGMTLLVVVAIVWLFIRVILKITKSNKGQSYLKDKDFWIESFVTVLLLALLASGALFKIFANIYDWTNKQDIGSQPTSRIELQLKDSEIRKA
jgi:NADH:ubiquinone oxidoreductase subunit 5 (subunit L)/multisubunit Na+/H+ antiporter MnhA subunit